jgi:PAS domain
MISSRVVATATKKSVGNVVAKQISTIRLPASNSSIQEDKIWSNQLSFASPESDYTGSTRPISSASATANADMSTNWSTQLSFASPESDFTSAVVARSMSTTASSSSVVSDSNSSTTNEWTNQLSFASPESDFVGQLVPEATLLTTEERSRLRTTTNESILNTLLSTVFGTTPLNQRQPTSVSLPKTFKEALVNYQNEAVVITTATAPYSIVYVNKAWEDMCGYKANEVLHETLQCIQGPKTNTKLAQSSIHKLLSSMSNTTSSPKATTPTPTEPVDMYLVNYRKDGSSFTNHVTMGTMTLNDDDLSVAQSDQHFLVGILQEVKPDQVPLRMI